MKIGILGSGTVGQTIGAKLAGLGHEVMIGTRSPEKLNDWKAKNEADVGSFAATAAFGAMVFNCTNGKWSIEALKMAGEANLNGKILIDISNALDFSSGQLSLFVCNTDSLGEQIQRAFPKVNVVKTLNTVTAAVMVNPALVPGDHAAFVSGNDAEAKLTVTSLLKEEFGWKAVIDLGDITSARAAEMYLPLWIKLWGALGTGMFNVQILKQG